MDQKPSKGQVLDYPMKWGIKAIFSDMKSRSFGITKTHLKKADCVERLILVATIATY